MPRDSRRRSPESSRRRRKERRNSRDQPSASAADSSLPGPMPGSMPDDDTPTADTPQPRSETQTRSYPEYQSQYPSQSFQQPYPPQSSQYPQEYTQQYPPPPSQQYSYQQYPSQQFEAPQNQSYYNPSPQPQAQPYGQPHQQQQPPPPQNTRPHTGHNSDSSSSTSSSFLNISRRKRFTKYGNVFTTFFRAPSEAGSDRSSQRHRKKKKTTFLSFNNSSSSSVDSDLAYGRGYIPRENDFRAGATGARRAPGASSSQQSRGEPRQHPLDPNRPAPPNRTKTDEEILAIGRQLSDIARKQNDADLRASGKNRPSQLVAAAAAVSNFRRTNTGDSKRDRGIGSSRPHGDDGDSDWESASEDEGSSDDGGLAYGGDVPVRRSNVAAAAGGAALAAGAAGLYGLSQQNGHRRGQESLVDPRLFGPQNSLRGLVTPLPDDPRQQDANRHGARQPQREEPPQLPSQGSSARPDRGPMQHVYPVPTSDPNNFDYDRGSTIASRQAPVQSARPAPVPLQQPVPVVPVSSRVYEADSFDDARRREAKHARSKSDGRILAGTAVAGVAGAAIGAAIASDRKEPRDYRRDDRREDRTYAPEASDPYDRERRERDGRSYRDQKVRIVDERDQARSVPKDDPYASGVSRRHTAPVETLKDYAYKLPQGDEIRVEYDREGDRDRDRRRRDDVRERGTDDRKPIVLEDRQKSVPSEPPAESKQKEKQRVEPPEAPSTRAAVDPFQFQVDDFQTPPVEAPRRPLTPQVFTVEREPDFSNMPAFVKPPPPLETRLSRKDSFEIEQRMEEEYRSSRNRSRTPEPRRRHTYEEDEHAAKSILDEARQATAPVSVAAFAAAIAVENERSRERRQADVDSDGSRSRSAAKRDTVQEDADRYYRESVIARKIAEDELRSRSASPNKEHSVIDKYQEEESPNIVTIAPPAMEEEEEEEDPSKHGPYAAPNADVRIDNTIIPYELSRFRIPDGHLGAGDDPFWKTRDPSCERDRPLLNLVRPTPVSTPNPEKQDRCAPRDAPTKEPSSDPKSVPDIIIGPRGEVIQSPSTPKSVTWGENETKSFEPESPEPSHSDDGEKEAKPRPKISKGSGWGILAGVLAGGAMLAKSDEDETKKPEDETSRSLVDEPRSSERRTFADEEEEPPVPGPKPASPSIADVSPMPGSFGNDNEFAAVLAAGLQDTGFDPNIVIDDPVYRRRDSPPGSNGEFYHHPTAETVTDLGVYEETSRDRSAPDAGYVIGEVGDAPAKEQDPEDDWASSAKLSKKERKKREKAAKRQSTEGDDDVLQSWEEQVPEPTPEAPAEPVEEVPFEKLSKKERKKREKAAARDVVVVQDEPPSAGTPDDWTSSQPADPVEDEWAAPTSSKKKKKKGKKSADVSEDSEERTVSVPVDSFDDLQTTRQAEPEPVADEWDLPKKSKKKSKRDSGAFDSPSRPASEVSVGSSKKDRRKSSDYAEPDDYVNEGDGDPPDRDRSRHSFMDDRDVTSVVSDPSSRYDRHERRYNGTRYDDDDTRSVTSFASAPDGRKSSSKDAKRGKGLEKRSSGSFFGIFGRNGSDSKEEDQKRKSDKDQQSFLDNAGTLGASVGLAGAAAALGYAASRQNATDAPSEQESFDAHDTRELSAGSRARGVDYIDPEIIARTIKPAIDPQYGDLLPLPPSEPSSPKKELSDEDLPALPESRPETPPEERNRLLQKPMHVRRRSAHDTPVKSPSHTAIPLQLRLGQRSTPSSPGFFKSSPIASPEIVSVPELATPKRPTRPTSWDNSREIKPLYLLEHSRSHDRDDGFALELPELPPSEPSESSRQSPAPGFESHDTMAKELTEDAPLSKGLRLDTDQLLHSGSQETTPKAEVQPEARGIDVHFALFDDVPLPIAEEVKTGNRSLVPDDELVELPPLPQSTSKSPDLEAEKDDPYPVDPMSKDRNSYLLYSTPPSIKKGLPQDVADQSPDATPSKRAPVDVMKDIQEETTDDAEPRKSGIWKAVAGVAAGGLAAAGLWAAADKKDEKSSERELPVDEPEAAAGQEVQAEPTEDDWSTPTPTKKKKGKKGKKSKEVAVEEPVEVPAPLVDPVPAVEEPPAAELGPEDVPPEAIAEAPQPVEDFVEPKLSKKDKKKKKKAQALDDWTVEEPQEAPKSLDDAEHPAVDPAPAEVVVDDVPTLPEPEPPVDDFAPVSKKDKKKKRKSQGWGDSTPEEPQETAKSLDDAEQPVVGAGVVDVQATPTESTESPAPETEFVPLSKKDKKKKRKSQSQGLDEWDAVAEEPQEASKALDIAEQPAVEPATDALDAGDSTPTEPKAVEDVFAPISKKDKKKKKKAAALEPEWAADDATKSLNVDQPAPEPVPEVLDLGEMTPTETKAPEDDFAPTSKKDKKKKKKAQAAWDDWGAEEHQDTSKSLDSSELPAATSGSSDIIVASETTPIEPLAAEDEFAPVSKKDKKKKKKTPTLEDIWAAEEPQESSKSLDVADPAIETVSDGIIPAKQETPAEHPPADDDWAPVSKADKKKKKKGKKAPAWTDEEPTTSEPVSAAQSAPGSPKIEVNAGPAQLEDLPSESARTPVMPAITESSDLGTRTLSPSLGAPMLSGFSEESKEDLESVSNWEDAQDTQPTELFHDSFDQPHSTDALHVEGSIKDDASDVFFDADSQTGRETPDEFARSIDDFLGGDSEATPKVSAQVPLDQPEALDLASSDPKAEEPVEADPLSEDTWAKPSKKSKKKKGKKAEAEAIVPEPQPADDAMLSASASSAPYSTTEPLEHHAASDIPGTPTETITEEPAPLDKTTPAEDEWSFTPTTKSSKKQKKKSKKGAVSDSLDMDDETTEIAAPIEEEASPLPTETPAEDMGLTSREAPVVEDPEFTTADKGKKKKKKNRKSVAFDFEQDGPSDSLQDSSAQDSQQEAALDVRPIAADTLPSEREIGAETPGDHNELTVEAPSEAEVRPTGGDDDLLPHLEQAGGGEATGAVEDLGVADRPEAPGDLTAHLDEPVPADPVAPVDDAPHLEQERSLDPQHDKSLEATQGTDAQAVDPALTDSEQGAGAPQELPGPALADASVTSELPQQDRSLGETFDPAITTEASTEGDMAVSEALPARPDDEWQATTTTSKKKGKKDKKKRQSLAFADEEPSEVSPPVQDVPVVESAEPVLEQIAAEAPEDDDTWSESVSTGKKGKKNKKKKVSSAFAWGDEADASQAADEQAQETAQPDETPLPESTPVDEPTSTIAPTVEEDTPAVAAEAGDDEWATPLTGKKAKKNKKKQGSSAISWDAPEPEPVQPTQEESKPLDTPSEEPPAEEAAPATESQPEPALETSLDEPPTTTPAEAEEDAWAVSASSKKGKKNKKKKSLPAWDDAEPAPLEEPQSWTEAAEAPAQPEEPTSWDTPGLTDTQQERYIAVEGPLSEAAEPAAAAPPTTEESPVAAAEDEWGTQPAGKKGKKNKKKKAAAFDAWDEPGPSASVDEASAEPSTEPSFETAEATPVQEDDTFELPGSKKSKKNKKRQSLLAAIPDESASQSEPQPEESGEQAEPEAAADDEWSVEPAGKKGKKGKKKRQSLAFDDLGETPSEHLADVQTEAPQDEASKSVELAEGQPPEPLDVQVAAEEPAQEPAVDMPVPSTNENAEEAAAPALDEEFSGSTKKSKKKKKKASPFDDFQDQPEVSEAPDSLEPVAEPQAENLSPQPDAQDEIPIPSEAEAKPVDEEDFGFVSKKSKKEKKKKKGLAREEPSDWTAEAESAPPSQGGNAGFEEKPFEDAPTSGADEPFAPSTEEEFSSSSSLSKKDKKKKKKGLLAAALTASLLPEVAAGTSVDEGQARSVTFDEPKDEAPVQPDTSTGPVPEAQPLDDVVAEAGANDSVPPPEQTEGLAKDAAPVVEVSTPVEEPTNADEEFSFMPKKSKKDRKKKGKSANFTETEAEPAPEPATVAEAFATHEAPASWADEVEEALDQDPMPEQVSSREVPADASISTADDPTQQPREATALPEEEFTLTSKKSKKDRKKKGKFADNAESTSGTATPAVVEEVPTFDEPKVDEPPVQDDIVPLPVEGDQSEAVVPDDEFSFSSKKTKKKKKGLSLAEIEPPSEIATPADEPPTTEPVPLASEETVPLGESGLESASFDPVSSTPAATDEWPSDAVVLKKSKKDKKKKKGMPQDDIETSTDSPAPEEPAAEETVSNELPALDSPLPETEITPGAATEVQPAATEEWPEETFITKKSSKKDKKKRKSKLQDDNDTPSGAATPAEEVMPQPEDNNTPTDKDISVDAAVSETVPERVVEPQESLPEDQTEAPLPETTPILEPEQASAPPEQLEEWPEETFVLNKSKKDKKKKKRASQFEPELEPEQVAQNDAQADAQELQQDPQVRDSSHEAPLESAVTGMPAEEAPGSTEEWSDFTSTKKGKKKKKGKGVALTDFEPEAAPEPIPEAAPAVEALDPPAEASEAPRDDIMPESTPHIDQDVVAESVEPISEPAQESSVPANEWSESTTKKGKKGKKKGKSISLWESEPAPEPADTTEAAIAPADSDRALDVGETDVPVLVQEGAAAEALAPEPAKDQVDITEEAPPVSAEEQPSTTADEWPDFSTKKSKKKKKGKAAIVDAEPEPEPAAAPAEPWVVPDDIPRDVDVTMTDFSAPAEPEPAPAAEVEPAPTDAQEPTAADDWSDFTTSTKKSKKGKKKAKALSWGDLESAEEPKSAPEVELPPIQDADTVAAPVVEEDQPIPDSAPLVPTEAQQAETVAEDFSEFTPMKKSKKSKKKAKAFSWDEPESAEEPKSAPDVDSTAAPAIDSDQPIPDTTIPESTQEQQPAAVAEELPEFTVTKKTKKDKKKKGRQSLDWLDDGDTPASTTETPPPEQDEPMPDAPIVAGLTDASAPESSAAAEEPPLDAPRSLDSADVAASEHHQLPDAESTLPIEAVAPDSSAEHTKLVADDVPPITEAPTQETQEQVQDSSDFFPAKPSKKDKKKKRASQVQFEEPQPSQAEPILPIEEAQDSQPVSEAALEPSEENREVAEAGQEPTETFFLKKSKKDKKKSKRQSLLADSEPATPIESPALETPAAFFDTPMAAEPEQLAEGDTAPVDAEQPAEPSEPVEDAWALPSKKKKGKKGKGSVSVDNSAPVSRALSPVRDSDVVMANDDLPREETGIPSDTHVEDLPPQSEPVAEDEWAPSTSKKKKKGKKGMAFAGLDTSEPSSRAMSPTREVDATPTDEVPEADLPQPSSLPETTSADAEPAVEDEWALPGGKKKKKGKKGKSLDVLEPEVVPEPVLADEPPPEPVAEAAQDISEKTPADTSDAVPAAQEPAADEEWGFTPMKKSKKDKKRAKASASASRSLSPTQDEPSETAVALVEPPVDAETPLAEAPVAAEDEWNVPVSSKKSKKGKKGKRGSVIESEQTSPRASGEDLQLEEPVADNDKAGISTWAKMGAAAAAGAIAGAALAGSQEHKDSEMQGHADGEKSVPSDDHARSRAIAAAYLENDHSHQAAYHTDKPEDREIGTVEPVDAKNPLGIISDDTTAMDVDQQGRLDDVWGDDTGGNEGMDDVWGEDTRGYNDMDDVWGDEPAEKKSRVASDVEMLWGGSSPSTKASARDIAASYLEHPHSSKTAETPKSPPAKENQETSSRSPKGAAPVTPKSGGGKKKKSKGKKRFEGKTPGGGDDLFDDPVLWEGADKKHVSEAASVEVERFWGTTPGEDENEEVEQTTRAVEESTPAEDQEQDIKPTLAEKLKKEEVEDLESPVLGRGDSREEEMTRSVPVETAIEPEPMRSAEAQEPVRLSTESMEIDQAIDRGFEDEQQRDFAAEAPTDNFTSPYEPHIDFKRSKSRGLPPVQEESEDFTTAQPLTRSLGTKEPELHDPDRDSGFVGELAQAVRRSNFVEPETRDSGVHLRDHHESTSRQAPRSPEPTWPTTPSRSLYGQEDTGSTIKPKLRRSPLSKGELRDSPLAKTPKLREPGPQDVTPEPQKSRHFTPEPTDKRSRYGDLGLAAGPAASSLTGRRSVSDHVARIQSPPVPPDSATNNSRSLRRTASNTSLTRHRTPEPLNLSGRYSRPESPASGIFRAASATPPLRRVDKRVSGDLRSLSQRSQVDLASPSPSPKPSPGLSAAAVAAGAAALGAAGLAAAAATSSSSNKDQDGDASKTRGGLNTTTPVANEGRVRAKDMADVYDGVGEGRIGSPRSPTRPHSMRRRQSMQVLELESRLEQLTAENRMLADAKAQADATYGQRSAGVLADRDAEIDQLKQSLEFLQKEVARLTEVNDGLNSANAQLASQHNDRYRSLETQHGETTRELEASRTSFGAFEASLGEKDAEISRLRGELEQAKEQIRAMQQQILNSKAGDSDFLKLKDVDHFDHRCQQLCSHVQQWVLRFSKFSDMRACRLTSEINEEKVIDRLDNAVLDGFDVDTYLGDRVKRRDIFMSMTMNMIWEFVFTRYLFGMDREQRQKLKSLEKLLTEVGPPQAVRQWRAVTLTLLSRRPSFKEQRELDTEAVVQAIFHTLSKVLPPPSNLEDQIQSQLRRVMREAVDLSVEMRTQRAEYMMLPPLQPTYDEEGELAETVTFNASLMNERSGDSSLTNEDLEAQGAVVRVVLFPLVVKKGDDTGEGDDEIVVCPAQVLVQRNHDKRRSTRLLTPSSDAGGALLGTPTATNRSDVSMSGGMYSPQQMRTPEADHYGTGSRRDEI